MGADRLAVILFHHAVPEEVILLEILGPVPRHRLTGRAVHGAHDIAFLQIYGVDIVRDGGRDAPVALLALPQGPFHPLPVRDVPCQGEDIGLVPDLDGACREEDVPDTPVPGSESRLVHAQFFLFIHLRHETITVLAGYPQVEVHGGMSQEFVAAVPGPRLEGTVHIEEPPGFPFGDGHGVGACMKGQGEFLFREEEPLLGPLLIGDVMDDVLKMAHTSHPDHACG